MRPLHAIVIHYLATPPQWCDQYDRLEDVVGEVRRWHSAIGYTDIGYHYVVGVEGSVAPGRPLDMVGAHVRGHNTGTIGIAYVGGLDDAGEAADTRTRAQREAIGGKCLELRARFGELAIVGHRDLSATLCPAYEAGPDFLDWAAEQRVPEPSIHPPPLTVQVPDREPLWRRVVERVRGLVGARSTREN